ncbi:MAG: SagB/ThcOx family dehydrogenase [Rhodocyclaceae bacterium]|nr:SagB/ThcOx family dehydrogenase [Rhodocyclaceae bacterium]
MNIFLPILLLAMASPCTAEVAGTEFASAGLRLPPPPSAGSVSLEEALAKRRSVRDFSPGALTLGEVSRLLWAAQGITGRERRTAPSAGALYPLEVYLEAHDVDDLPPGLYRYQPSQHRLEAVAGAVVRQNLVAAANGQQWLGRSAAVITLAARFGRTAARYGKRGERYVHIETGHAAQNLLLQATALGLCATPVGSFDDAAVSRLFHLSDHEAPLLLLPVGRCPRP